MSLFFEIKQNREDRGFIEKDKLEKLNLTYKQCILIILNVL